MPRFLSRLLLLFFTNETHADAVKQGYFVKVVTTGSNPVRSLFARCSAYIKTKMMIELKGTYNQDCKIFIDEVETEAIELVRNILNRKSLPEYKYESCRIPTWVRES